MEENENFKKVNKKINDEERHLFHEGGDDVEETK
jgi:hypothetical protein